MDVTPASGNAAAGRNAPPRERRGTTEASSKPLHGEFRSAILKANSSRSAKALGSELPYMQIFHQRLREHVLRESNRFVAKFLSGDPR